MLRLGLAAGKVTRDRMAGRSVQPLTAVIGHDTRLSGGMIEHALCAGLTSAGARVFLVGTVPTPAIGLLTSSMRADLGVMITASHNPFEDNGVKLFGPDGYKFDAGLEREIMALMEGDISQARVAPGQIGVATGLSDGSGRYIEAAKRTLPKGTSLSGLKVVVDCANGAAYRTAPVILAELGAEVEAMGVSPDGMNINLGCGSTHPQALAERVRASRADIGIALDGDADRVILVDETGKVADGDQILACIGLQMHKAGTLKGGALVATIMSNLGLEHFLQQHSLRLERTKVGDHHVVARMKSGGFNLGGEQSGHVILRDHATSGDGLVAAMQVLAAMISEGKSASQCLNNFAPLPQHMVNVRLGFASDPMEAPSVVAAIRQTEAELGTKGRLVIRKSGTEPLVRVMVEAQDASLAQAAAEGLAAVVRAEVEQSS
jgi:phosphoglucosamine mutase